MEFKEIKNKKTYLKENYPFYKVPKLTSMKHCIHCKNDFMVGDYKVKVENQKEYIVCPNAPECNGTLMDWIEIDNKLNMIDVKKKIYELMEEYERIRNHEFDKYEDEFDVEDWKDRIETLFYLLDIKFEPIDK